MREILFRGKRIDNGEWVKGKLLTNKRIITKSDDEVEKMPCFDMCDYQEEIDIETLGQYVGLTDKNGTNIFEGDIVKVYPYGYEEIGFVKYCQNAFRVVECFEGEECPLVCPEAEPLMVEATIIEVIGNVFDNPELLEGVC